MEDCCFDNYGNFELVCLQGNLAKQTILKVLLNNLQSTLSVLKLPYGSFLKGRFFTTRIVIAQKSTKE